MALVNANVCMCLPCPFSPASTQAALAKLQEASLITPEERVMLNDVSDVVNVQKGKSPNVIAITVKVLREHGFQDESDLLAGIS